MFWIGEKKGGKREGERERPTRTRNTSREKLSTCLLAREENVSRVEFSESFGREWLHLVERRKSLEDDGRETLVRVSIEPTIEFHRG